MAAFLLRRCNPYANIRQPIVHTLNFIHMMPVSAVFLPRADFEGGVPTRWGTVA